LDRVSIDALVFALDPNMALQGVHVGVSITVGFIRPAVIASGGELDASRRVNKGSVLLQGSGVDEIERSPIRPQRSRERKVA
jgi:hypothetical protein